jgi:OmpA-OmpF porin, OOP family
MKYIAVGALFATAFVSQTAAGEFDVPSRYNWVGAHLSEHVWDFNSRGEDRLTRTSLPGLRAGQRFAPHWSAQASWEKNNARFDRSRAPASLNIALASLRYHFSDHAVAGFEPYLGSAVGRSRLRVDAKNNDQTVWGAEFGAQHRLRAHWLLDVGARPFYGFDKEQWDAEVYLGLNLIFGIQ